MQKCKLVAYYRVSTDQQGRSGLGLEAQQAAVASYADSNGCTIVASFTEVESARKRGQDKRPELLRALAAAKRHKAALVIAKLDRLTRNARFLLTLVESGVDLCFCDFPNVPVGAAGKFMLTQFAAVAELEGGLTSERTKAALAAAKARGVLLGAARPGAVQLTDESRARGRATVGRLATAAAIDAYADVTPLIRDLYSAGNPFTTIAAHLNQLGHTTRNGAQWSDVQVRRLLKRAGCLKS